MADSHNDPLYDAERQMAEHELSLFTALFARLSRQFGYEDLPSSEEIQATARRLIQEDPEFVSLAERLALMQRQRGDDA
jgi:hypothetical protein